ncbi:hypothetical protein C0638_01215 [Paenibacillus sp. lzh-N1]|uniref:hypothetical protein n=1 Tax=Paenibacillus sp. lzh-N1 TaxID=2069255 RepID=UPI000C807F40|nr:hypothetical protein [Paenibacillus sp. lzh-N1]AUO05286.1 hypothetical protein C0638_01215 [Paenibacillus sp. lzh-N1]
MKLGVLFNFKSGEKYKANGSFNYTNTQAEQDELLKWVNGFAIGMGNNSEIDVVLDDEQVTKRYSDLYSVEFIVEAEVH